MQTQFQQRESGDRMLAVVLEGYPEQAYTVTIGSIRSSFDSRRNASLAVRYAVNMSSVYLNALSEVAGVIAADSRSCSGLARTLIGGLRTHPNSPGPGSPGGGPAVSPNISRMAEDACGDSSDLMVHTGGWNGMFGGSVGFIFADDRPLKLINAKLWGPHFLRADFYDEADRLVTSSCTQIRSSDLFKTRGPDTRRRVYNYNEGRTRDRPELSSSVSIGGDWNTSVGQGSLGTLSGISRMSARVVGSC
jgi:hypothetical protein